MKKRTALITMVSWVLLSLISPVIAADADDNRLSMMWWNVENLFDTHNDPLTEDSEFTPEGRKRWTEKKLLLKYIRLSHIIKVVQLQKGSYPDVLVLGEVENPRVFNRLLSFLPESRYKTAYHDSDDPRGIDIALAYDSTSVVLDSSFSRKIDLKGKNTRDITLYSFSVNSNPFFLLVNHWPSRVLDTAWSEPQRLLAAKTARSIIDSLMSTSIHADIVVMGDFNDEPHDRSIREILGATTDKKAFMENPGKKLLNCWVELDEKGSCYFGGRWLKFDQVMVSSGLFDEKGLSLSENAFSCFHIQHMQTGRSARPNATYKGPKYLGGYSDHFPILFEAITR
ncbi:endonuclease [Prosthecochloris sp.]|uniref:endonuclease/exonuclease/phosphatase family protein n=1 Tax=Prosthecochloris sp. TaxID=290513 RepID=UPI0025CDD67C|nr:endonuclease [Prosthecochloris sp.]